MYYVSYAIIILRDYTHLQIQLFHFQGALVASAMIIIQHNENMTKNSRVMDIRKTYAKIISDRLEDSVAKFGAILAQGIVDTGIIRSCNLFKYCLMSNLNNVERKGDHERNNRQ